MKPHTFGLLAVAGASLAAALAGCAATPPAPARAILVGAQSESTRILIRSVDDGNTLWVAPGALGAKVTVAPGHHIVHAVCDVVGSWVYRDVSVDAAPGQTYQLVGSVTPAPGKCQVTVSGHT
jgi:hypothetical protein